MEAYLQGPVVAFNVYDRRKASAIAKRLPDLQGPNHVEALRGRIVISARNEGKLANQCRLRAATVSAEAKTFQLQIDGRSWLAAAVGGEVRFLADAAGLTSDVKLRTCKSPSFTHARSHSNT